MIKAILIMAWATSSMAIAQTDYTATDLSEMNQWELDDLYLTLEAGEIPDGESDGTAVFFPGSIINRPAILLAALVWQGKVFDTEEEVLENRVFGFRKVKAEVYKDVSLLDGDESIIIDYEDTSFAFQKVRDEIRQVGPNLYLGRAYVRTLLVDYMAVNFILEFNN